MERENSLQEMHRERVTGISMHNVVLEDTKFEMKYADIAEMYRKVLCMRYMDENVEKMYSEGLVRGFCHFDIGQEGIYGGLHYVSKGDKFIGSYRCHALAIAAGISIKEVVGELLGRKGGVSKGKGGSMHLYNDTLYGGHGIVGAQVPLGCGMAYALKYREGLDDVSENSAKNVVFCFYGDGATNQGQVHESFNIAKIWSLPIVFIVINNAYGMWTPALDVCANEDFYRRSDFLPGLRVSGRDVFSMIKCLEFSREHALKKGPVILQIDTYRFCGHSTTDDIVYRDEEEVRAERKNDVVTRLEEVLARSLSTEFVKNTKAETKQHVKREIEEALKMDEPEKSELYTDILGK